MPCRFTYAGKTYSEDEFRNVIKAMPISEAAKYVDGLTSIPSAPFVEKTEDWTALALKTILQKAAAEGYDAVAWTTGDQQAERYDLSKQVKEISVVPRTDAETGERTREVNVFIPNGARIQLGVDNKGIVDNSTTHADMKGKRLDEIIGKEMADKVMAVEGQKWFRGLDLKVGGEGMKAYYDRIVPQVAEKIGKKFGAKVGPIRFSGKKVTSYVNPDGSVATLEDGERPKPGATRKDITKPGPTVHSISISPEMRQSIKNQGFPLFSRQEQMSESEWENYNGIPDDAAMMKTDYRDGIQVDGAQKGVRIVDFKKDVSASLLKAMAKTRAALASKVSMAERLILRHVPDFRFGGFSPSGNMHGVKVNGMVFINDLATHQLALETARTERITYDEAFARHLFDVITHEAAHYKESGHGPEFEAELARIVDALGAPAVNELMRDFRRYAADLNHRARTNKMYEEALPGWREGERRGREAAKSRAEETGGSDADVAERLRPQPRSDTGGDEDAGAEYGRRGGVSETGREPAEGLAASAGVRGTDERLARADVFFVFKPEQIKSATGNHGTFDPNNPSIVAEERQPYGAPPPGSGETSEGGGLSIPEETYLQAIERKVRDRLNRVGVVQKAAEVQTGVKAGKDLQAEFQGISPRAAATVDYVEKVVMEPIVKQIGKDRLDYRLLGEYAQAKHAPARDRAILNDALMGAAPDAVSLEDAIEDLKKRPWYGKPDEDGKRKRIGSQYDKIVRSMSNGSGMTPARVAEVLSKVKASGKQAQYEAAREMIRQVYDLGLQVLERGGLTTQERISALREKFGPDFVSLRDENPEGLEKFMAAGAGYSVRGPEWQRAKGRTSEASSHPLETALQGLERAILRAERNRAESDFADFVKSVDDPELGTVKEGDPTENGIGFKVAGKQMSIELPDERLREALKSLSVNQKDLLTQTMGGFTRWFSRVNTQLSVPFVFRNGIRDYGGAVLSSIILHGFKPLRVNGTIRGESIPAYVALHEQNAIKAVRNYSLDPKKEWPAGSLEAYAKEGIANGAIPGYFAAVQPLSEIHSQLTSHLRDTLPLTEFLKMAASDIADIARESDPGAKNDALRRAAEPFVKAARVVGVAGTAASRASGMKLILSNLKAVNNYVEAATRINYYAALRKSGVSAREAANKARQLIDFSRKGEVSPSLNAIWAFFHANVEGTARLAEFARSKDPAVRTRAAGVFAALITAGALWDIFVAAMSGDKDDDGVPDSDQIPLWASERAMVTPAIGNMAPFIIPFAQGFAVPFFAGQLFSKVARGRMRIGKALYETAVSAANAFNPIGTTYGMPTAVQPVAEVIGNQDWRGRQINPTRYPGMDGVPDSRLSFKRTSPAMKTFAQAMNDLTGGSEFKSGLLDVSPGTLEHYAQFFSGGAGRFFGESLDAVGSLVKGEEPAKIPVVDSFRIDQDAGYRSRFYDQMAHFNSIEGTSKKMERKDRTEMLPESIRPKVEQVSIAKLRQITGGEAPVWLSKSMDDNDRRILVLKPYADRAEKEMKRLSELPAGADRDEKMRRLYLDFNRRYQKATEGVIQ